MIIETTHAFRCISVCLEAAEQFPKKSESEICMPADLNLLISSCVVDWTYGRCIWR